MPPKRQRLRNEANMKAAMLAIQRKQMGFLKDQQTYIMSQEIHCFDLLSAWKKTQGCKLQILCQCLRRKPVFPPHLEKELADHCLELEKRFFGLSMSDVRRLAYQLASANNIANPFNEEEKNAGRKWFRKFLARNPELFLRTPQGVSLNSESEDGEVSSSNCSSDGDRDAECIYCTGLWSKSITDWVQCQLCKNWAHETYARYPKKNFFCNKCGDSTQLWLKK